MNEIVKSGEVFKLADLVAYENDNIVTTVVVDNDSMKLALKSFDEGTSLPPHPAPGNALVFALEGEAVMEYEGVDHTFKAGSTFKFDKGGMHSVKPNGKFKMAVLLVKG